LSAQIANPAAGDVVAYDGAVFRNRPGGLVEPLRVLAADAIAMTDDRAIAYDASGGPRTLTLFPATGNDGRMLTVWKEDVSANALTLAAASGETIDGEASVRLYGRGAVTLVARGGVWRIVEGRERVVPFLPALDVTWFGARGDGATDDLDAINRAAAVANELGGGVVVIPAGRTFVIKPTTTKWIVCHSRVNWRIEGVLKVAGTTGDYKYLFAPASGPGGYVEQIRWSGGGWIDQNPSGNTSSNISSTNPQAVFRFDNFTDLVWDGVTLNPYTGMNAWQLFGSQQNSKHARIVNCRARFERGASSTFYDTSTIYASCTHAVIANNVLTYEGSGALAPQGAIEVHGPHQVVLGNVVEKFGVGSWLVAETGAATSRPVHGIVCANNTYLSCGLGIGVVSSVPSKVVRHIIIAGNSIHLDTLFHEMRSILGGIMLSSDPGWAPSEKVTIVNNVITFEPGETRTLTSDGRTIVWQPGIKIAAPPGETLRGLICAHNQIYNAPTTGITLGIDATLQDVSVRQNLIVNAGGNPNVNALDRAGIRVYGSSSFERVLIEDNWIVDTGTPSPVGQYAWHISALSGAATDLTFRRNSATAVSGSLQAFIGNPGPNTGVTTIAADYTATVMDEVIAVDAAGGSRTVTLPPLGLAAGKRLVVKKIDTSSHGVTVTRNGAQGTIEGAASRTLRSQWAYLELVCDGSRWLIVGSGGSVS